MRTIRGVLKPLLWYMIYFTTYRLSAAEYAEEMKCNYERYRNLVINLFQEGMYACL